MAELHRNFFAEDADILPPSDDRIFKTLLTHPNNEKALIDIVSTVIDRRVLSVQVRNTELPTMDVEEKNQRFDINCVVDTGDQVNVEMHCSDIQEIGNSRTNFLNKYIYYGTDLHSSQKSKGVEYENLVRTYQVTFCMDTVFPELPHFVNRFSLRTPEGIQLNDQLNIVLVELSKLDETLKKPVKELTSFEKWSLFLRFAQNPMHRKLINDIIDNKKEIEMAATLLREISQDECERARLRSRRMYETDMISNLLTAERRGRLQAEKEWQEVVADKDAKLADSMAENERLRVQISELQKNNNH